MTADRWVLLRFALITACLAGIVVIAGGSADPRILLSIPRHSFSTEIAVSITALGSSAVLVLLTLLSAAFLILHRRFRTAAIVAAAYAGAELISQILKHLVNRPRPDVVPHLVRVTDASFPSGHALTSAAVYLTLGILLARFARSSSTERRGVPGFFLVAAVLLTTLVGLSRLYLGVHWPTDVLGGWSLGALWALLLSFAGS